MKISAVLKKDAAPVPPGKIVDMKEEDARSLIASGAAEPVKRGEVEAEAETDDKDKQQ
ncbi:MAG: hypothetical protein IPK59_10335 [Rhodospirillaceae bacterium]|nr:hypothetical protein [Rhodospirillaceae bacterium]